MKRMFTTLIIAFIIFIGVVVAGPLFIVNEGEQAVVVQFGRITNVITTAGLKLKIPFIDEVVRYPKKIMAWDGEARIVPTAERQFIFVDVVARWRIADPMKFYESINTVDAAYSKLAEIIDSEVRTVVAENPLRESVRNSNIIMERFSYTDTLELDDDIDTERQLQAHVVEQEALVQREINALEAELARQQEAERQRRLREQRSGGGSSGSGAVVGSGELMWPVSGSITSGFGVRKHPVYNDLRQHNGIDIAAPHGTTVVAADAGTVLTSAYNSSYGNYIVISHGNGMTTLYAHLSTRSVSAGSTVSRGQQVGLIGSTGISTGPHLHFEVSVNGSRINPRLKLPNS